MKKIDWYILKKFLGTFVFIMALLLCITIVIDISEKIDNFIDGDATWQTIVFKYYLNFIPFIASLLAPFFVLVAVIFFTSQLAERSEIIAILNSGTSFNRFLYPYFVGACILAFVLYVGNNYVIPSANTRRLEFENTYINKYTNTISYSFQRQISTGVFIYMENYVPFEGKGYKFAIDKFEKGKLVYKLRADKIAWQKSLKKWRINDYYTRQIGEEGDVIFNAAQLDTVFSFTPDNFSFTSSVKENMTTPELTDYIERMKKSGQSEVEFYEVERYRRTSIAFSVFIMTLIGVSLASQKVRGGLGWHLVLGIGLSALYEIIMKFSVTFSTNSSLPPFLGVWIPNFIFGGIAVYLMKKAPK
jgi:lipopolysaccharide export system permease protein